MCAPNSPGEDGELYIVLYTIYGKLYDKHTGTRKLALATRSPIVGISSRVTRDRFDGHERSTQNDFARWPKDKEAKDKRLAGSRRETRNVERKEGEGRRRRSQRFVAVNAWTIASGLTEVTPTSGRGKQMPVDLRGYGREDNGASAKRTAGSRTF